VHYLVEHSLVGNKRQQVIHGQPANMVIGLIPTPGSQATDGLHQEEPKQAHAQQDVDCYLQMGKTRNDPKF